MLLRYKTQEEIMTEIENAMNNENDVGYGKFAKNIHKHGYNARLYIKKRNRKNNVIYGLKIIKIDGTDEIDLSNY